MPAALSRARAALPRPTGRALTSLAVGGAFAMPACDLTMRVLTPLAAEIGPGLGAPLSAATLADGLLGMLAPGASAGQADLGFALHCLVGLVLQPLGLVALARPAMAAVWPRAPWVVTALVYGTALWGGAMWVLRALSMDERGGIVPMETGLAALWGHLALALVLGGIWRARMGR